MITDVLAPLNKLGTISRNVVFLTYPYTQVLIHSSQKHVRIRAHAVPVLKQYQEPQQRLSGDCLDMRHSVVMHRLMMAL